MFPINHELWTFMSRRMPVWDGVGGLNLQSIGKHIAATQAQVADAAGTAHRDPASITIIAVSKRKPVADIEAAYAAGLSNFGENYLQEALPKIQALAHLDATWHFIGAIQSNKTRAIAEHFHWVHTLDRTKIARRLNDACPHGKTLQVCLQVNVDEDPAKAGLSPGETAKVLSQVAELPALRVRGLMTILHIDADPLASYGRLRTLFDDLRTMAGPAWDSLSMGMSRDFEQAIAAGATHVRIGTDIFGARE